LECGRDGALDEQFGEGEVILGHGFALSARYDSEAKPKQPHGITPKR
jgi:hypothetical protein